MLYQPQRFIHAANVRLDVPVGVHLSQRLTNELRYQLEDATLLAFNSVIVNCIELEVDYLLLSGNIFVEADRSLRARLALLRGFRTLCDRKISVFILPGDTDPPEAWRAISELPENVHVCYSSGAEPVELRRSGRTMATVAASMWYGETDAFGIRVIHSNPDGIEPFRIGTVSRAGFDTSRRMAGLTKTCENKLTGLDGCIETEPRNENVKQPAFSKGPDTDDEAGFRDHIQRLVHDGKLNYLALSGELERSEFRLEAGVVHCPGTTQPRSGQEADSGLCSLVTVEDSGNFSIQELNTSVVDWKNITVRLLPGTEPEHLIEQMRGLLLKACCSPSNRIWAVSWTFTGPLPVLRSFVDDDLETVVTEKLDEFYRGEQPIRLLHQIRMVPDAWHFSDADHLAQQYAELIPQDNQIHREALLASLDEAELSSGWIHRLKALANGIDPHRLIAHLRNDGADWFIENPDKLLPHKTQEGTRLETNLDIISADSSGADTDIESDGLASELDSETTLMMTEDQDKGDRGKEVENDAGPIF